MSGNPSNTAASSVDFSDAMVKSLESLGVHPGILNACECESLDRHGFLVLREMMDADALTSFRQVHERLMSLKYPDPSRPTPPVAGHDSWHHEPGTRRLADLVSEDPLYDRAYTNPRLLSAVARLFGRDFQLHSINARDALPGEGHQGFHRDGPNPAGACHFVNSAWLLDDFTASNGATRVIPGSFLHRDLPESPPAPHPGEVLITAPAGSVIVFRSDLLHAGTANRSGFMRRVFHVFWSRRDVDLGGFAYRLRNRIRKATWERISPAARWLLDV